MTDKVQKIREEIEKRPKYWKEKEFNSHSIESEIRMSECQHLLLIVDSLQEESKPQFKVGDIIRSKVWKSAAHEIVSMDDSAYYFENGGMVKFDDQEQWELAEEPVSIWHDSNKEQPDYASTVAIWSPKYKNGEIISRCTEVYSDRIWAYIDDLLKM